MPQRYARVVELQSLIVFLLGADTFGAWELEQARLLLREQRNTIAALGHLITLPPEPLIPVLRRWSELHRDGCSALALLEAYDDLRATWEIAFEDVLSRLDATVDLPSYEPLLRELASLVEQLRSIAWRQALHQRSFAPLETPPSHSRPPSPAAVAVPAAPALEAVTHTRPSMDITTEARPAQEPSRPTPVRLQASVQTTAGASATVEAARAYLALMKRYGELPAPFPPRR